jgi:uncharacterized membrane protein
MPLRSPQSAGCLGAALLVLLLVLFPFIFANVMLGALAKLGLSPEASLLVAFGILFGSLINLPVYRIHRREPMALPRGPLTLIASLRPGTFQPQRQTVIAVNLGGCLVPAAVALYQIGRLIAAGPWPVIACLLALTVNVASCYVSARPVRGMGIAMMPLVPALVAVVCALVLLPGFAPPVAFVAGTLGPIIGADLLHLRDIERISTGLASIGGAGTFDGIVICGIIAALLTPIAG